MRLLWCSSLAVQQQAEGSQAAAAVAAATAAAAAAAAEAQNTPREEAAVQTAEISLHCTTQRPLLAVDLCMQHLAS